MLTQNVKLKCYILKMLNLKINIKYKCSNVKSTYYIEMFNLMENLNINMSFKLKVNIQLICKFTLPVPGSTVTKAVCAVHCPLWVVRQSDCAALCHVSSRCSQVQRFSTTTALGKSVVDAVAVAVTIALIADALLKLCIALKTVLPLIPARPLDMLAGNMRAR